MARRKGGSNEIGKTGINNEIGGCDITGGMGRESGAIYWAIEGVGGSR